MLGETKPPRLFSRRDVLRLAGGAAALAVSTFLLAPRPAFGSVLPPGALAPVGLFQAACVRCGHCVTACPHRAIRQNGEGLPYIDGLGGWCDVCLDCVKVCPTGALQPVNPEEVVLGTAVIDHNQCIAWRRMGCRLCYEKCLTLRQAISVDRSWHPEVDASRCNGCGACVNVCPQADVDGRSKDLGRAIALKGMRYG